MRILILLVSFLFAFDTSIDKLFNEAPFRFLGGCSINDANHISAPHKEAKGLIQSIINTLNICNLKAKRY